MKKKNVGPLAWVLATGLGTAQFSMAQMGGAGGMGGTYQYGGLEILGIVIGVAVVILLVVLVARKSKT